jgi:hypothetical protein
MVKKNPYLVRSIEHLVDNIQGQLTGQLEYVKVYLFKYVTYIFVSLSEVIETSHL